MPILNTGLKLLLFIFSLLIFANWRINADNAGSTAKPNIVIIMADDLGFDDVSFRGSNEFLTPNIDALAYSGIILNNLYTSAMCTPSRAALLTGKYPISTGMQHYVIVNDQPWSLPVNETTMAQIFQQNGYYTSLIGKWHLGMSRKAYTPTQRGFDQHLGYLGAYIDYYDQTYFSLSRNYSRGHDFRANLNVSRDYIGSYVTDVFTEAAIKLIKTHNTTRQPLFLMLNHLAPHAANDENPMQAPPEEVERFAYIKSITRRYYAAMVSRLDRSVGLVVNALASRQILNNTVILFLSDNGGPTLGSHATSASNYPLRGQKNSPWEGGIRSSAAIWSTQFEKLNTVWKQRIYIADFLPTLAAAAGIELDETLKLDGLNLWSALKYGYESVEREIMHNIDDEVPYLAFTKGKWKFINGTTEHGTYDGWLGSRPEDGSTEQDPRANNYVATIQNTTVWQHLQREAALLQPNITGLRAQATIKCSLSDDSVGVSCNPLLKPCLFDIEMDPCELNNVYDGHKTLVAELIERVEYFRAHAHPPNNKPLDPDCDPRFYHSEWTWWEEETKSSASQIHYTHGIFAYIACYMSWLLWQP